MSSERKNIRGYYITTEYTEINIRKKINMQMTAMREHCSVDEVTLTLKKDRTVLDKIAYRIPPLPARTWDGDAVLSKIKNPDFIYMRRLTADRDLFLFFGKIKRKYPKCKIIVEFFTYPYMKDEFSKVSRWTIGLRDICFRSYYKKYVDCIVTYSQDKEIFGTKAIPIINGIDPKEYPMVSSINDTDELHLLAVAVFQKHHGYERVIKGLAKYYRGNWKKVVKLYFVGYGPDERMYRELVRKYKLGRHVKFFGEKQGKALDRVYEKSDIGLAPFGLYRDGVNMTSALKTREYFSKGLAVAGGGKQDVIEKYKADFYLEYSNDNSLVDIFQMVDFYDQLLKNHSNDKRKLASDIHSYAEENLSMATTFWPVIQYIKESADTLGGNQE